MLQAVATLASLLVLAIACKVMASSILGELPALRALIGPRTPPVLAPVRIRTLPARRAAMIRIAAPLPGRVAA